MCFSFAKGQHEKINFALKLELEKHLDSDELFPLFVLGDPVKIKNEVIKLKGEIIRSTGSIVQVKLPINTISTFSKNTFVQSLPYSFSKGKALNDTMLIHNNVVPIHNGDIPLLSSYTGKGVVYGIIDTGVDPDHLDFKDANGKTRIYRALDQVTGDICDSAAINNGTCTVNDASGVGHGTHVAGISVGNGLAINMFKGVAPEATIVTVKSDFNAPNWLTTVVDAVDYIYTVADSLNMPCVINASIGDYFGSHDGTDPAALLIDSIINYKEGRAFVCAGGNAGFFKWHVEQTVTVDTSFSWLKANPTSGDVFFEVWSDTLDFDNVDYAFGANLPSGSFAERGRTPFFNIQNRLGYNVDSIMNGSSVLAIVETYAELQDDKYLLQVFLDNPDSNTYNFSMLSTGNGKYDFWSTRLLGTSDVVETGLPTLAQYPAIAFYTLPDSNQTIVSSFSCLPSILTVANFENRKTYLDVDTMEILNSATAGEIANSSSLGPDRRGNVKPDIGATGNFTLGPAPASVIAAGLASTPVNRSRVAIGGKHRINGGTSMASPVVAGIVALYLEKCPTSTMAEIKAAVIGTARQDGFTGALPNSSFGYGKVDAFAVLNNSNYNVSIGSDKNVCDGDSVQVISPNYSSYNWSTGDTVQSLYFDSTATDIYLEVTNTSGCLSRSDTVNIIWRALPIKPTVLVVGNDTLLYGTNLNLQWYYNSNALSGENDTLHFAQNNGDYYVEVADMFGCSEVSDTVALTTVGVEENVNNSFSIYPNPSKGNLLVKMFNNQFQSLRVINLLGEVLVDRNIERNENEIELKLDGFAEGVYYVQLNSAEGKYLQKLILLR
ncbi:MAG: S8 family peptidase [Vicingaceae bacterium]|nr:S8 family peptidase [Vicingaceae bacterium]